ncbi:MAG: hypothetical protein J6S19_07180 [Lentisphaeria bacterium]|nr:hypothetical protein [Lentisphaeria bacterium]
MSGKILSLILLLGAVIALTGCTERELDNAVLLNRAVENGRVGNWQECEKNSLTVLKRDPGNINALMLRALASEHLGKMDVALAAARQAAENDPENFAAQYIYGRLLALKSESAKSAVQILERANKLRPGNRNTLILLGQCSSNINADNAIEYYLALPEKVRKLPEIQTRMAIYYLDRRDRSQRNLALAFQALRNAYVTSPDNPVIVLNMAKFLDHYIKNKLKAVGFYRRYLRLTEHNPELNPTRAQVQARMSELR